MNLTNIIFLAVLSVVILLASYLIGGTYSIVPVSNANAVGNYVMNRYTGRVWLCNVQVCKVVVGNGEVSQELTLQDRNAPVAAAAPDGRGQPGRQ